MYLPAPDEHLLVGVLRLSLHIPGSRSLKDRRRVLNALRDRVAARHHAHLAEVGHLENHQAAILAVALVANDARVLRSRLDSVRAEAESAAELIIADQTTEIFPFSGQERL